MSEKISCKNCDNSFCFIRQYCSSGWVNRIDLSKVQIHHHAKDNIFREGGYVYGVYFIQRGNVKIIATGVNNREQIVRLASDGQILGHRGNGVDKYPVSAVALSDTVVCFIDNEMLHSAFMDNPKLTIEMMTYYSSELRKVEIRMKYLVQMTVKEKIAESFLYIQKVFGINKINKMLNVPMSRQEIADMSGVMQVQVSRELKEFEDQNLITRQGREIRLMDLAGLQYIVRKYNIAQYAEQDIEQDVYYPPSIGYSNR